jgi:protein gp37
MSCEPLLAALGDLNLAGIGWVIAGGENGRACRPVAAKWIRQSRNGCGRQSVPFFIKQWGRPTPKSEGRMLDGRTWDEMPLAMSP